MKSLEELWDLYDCMYADENTSEYERHRRRCVFYSGAAAQMRLVLEALDMADGGRLIASCLAELRQFHRGDLTGEKSGPH
jgi:hypothetical protein